MTTQTNLSSKTIKMTAVVILCVAFVFTFLLVIKSLTDFSHTGPQIKKEIMESYKLYIGYAVARLAFWSFVISLWLAGIGILAYVCMTIALGRRITRLGAVISGASGLIVITVVQFCKHLFYIPGSIMASFLYRISRFYPLWERLSQERLFTVQLMLLGLAAALIFFSANRLIKQKMWPALFSILVFCSAFSGIYIWAAWNPEPSQPVLQAGHIRNRPNIVMIGSDTLRADRLGAAGYRRKLTPYIDKLAKQGTQFTNCFIPLARTAPSLTSLLTGTWPHTNGLRDNFISDKEVNLPIRSLPELLSGAGYRTAAISDWAGADLGKIKYGFEFVETAQDQWNIKYLIRQGPKDLRLFVSLFTHNRFGKIFLPEIYYLAGTPLSREIGRSARTQISEFAAGEAPFFLMVFTSNTHIPFGSEYPYYTLYSDPNYRGESKFVMSGLTDPDAIIKKQSQGRDAFDVQQVVDLYDGGVRSFDDEVSGLVNFIKDRGLEQSTIIVIFSDHGLDLFERNTWGQGNSVMGDDPSARIPLIIMDPRRKGANIVSSVTRSIDVAPTLLELIGMPAPDSMEGKSLVSYMDNRDTNLNLDAFYETGIWLAPLPEIKKNHLSYPSLLNILEVPDKNTGTLAVKPEFRDIVIEARDRMIRTDRWKLVYLPMKEGAVYWLYDVLKDPKGLNDVSSQHPEIVRELKDRLTAWMSEDKKIR